MQQRRLGDLTVSAIGLGGMPLSIPRERRPDRAQALATVHAALDAGVTLIDTADCYCAGPAEFGHNEELVAEALRTWGGDTSDVLVATKGGHTRPTDDDWGLAGSPAYLREACEGSLRRLGVEAIGLYQYHRPDPTVAWAESVGALEELRAEGKIRFVGVSNADPEQIREADATTRLAAVQNQLSPTFTSSLPELRLCAELGIAFLPGPRSAGSGRTPPAGSSARSPPSGRSAPQQVVLAWLLALDDVVVPIPGASRPASIQSSAAAADLELSSDELARLESYSSPSSV